MTLSRRALLGGGLGLPALVASARAGVRAAARVIVVGGGFAGATCARVLRQVAPHLQVALIEPRRHFFTGPMCNAMLAGLVPVAGVRQGPAALRDEGIVWIARGARVVDPSRRRVQLDDRRWLDADRLVLAPGIGMRWDTIDGLDAGSSLRLPHAWMGDAQLRALRRRGHRDSAEPIPLPAGAVRARQPDRMVDEPAQPARQGAVAGRQG